MDRRTFLGNVSAMAGTVAAYSLAPELRALAQSEGDGSLAIAETSTGKVRRLVDTGVHVFRGIPYGGPTGGKMRFLYEGTRATMVFDNEPKVAHDPLGAERHLWATVIGYPS